MQVLSSLEAMILWSLSVPKIVFKNKPLTRLYENKAKNFLKGEIKRRGLTYAQLAERLEAIGVPETERNLANKISRGGFTAAFLIQCLAAIGAHTVRLED
jgi:hypothetical protein